MSYKLVAAVFAAGPLLKSRGLISADAHVLAVLAGHLNDETKRCDPGYGAVEEETIKSHSTIAVCLKALYGAGFIDWEVRKKSGSKENNTNFYKIPHKPDPKAPKDKFILTPWSVRDQDEINAKFAKSSKSRFRTVNTKSDNSSESRFRTTVVQNSDQVVQISDYPSPESGREQVSEQVKNREDNIEVVGGVKAHRSDGVEVESLFFSTDEELAGEQDRDSMTVEMESVSDIFLESSGEPEDHEQTEERDSPTATYASVARVETPGEESSVFVNPGSSDSSEKPTSDPAPDPPDDQEYLAEPDPGPAQRSPSSEARELAVYYYALLGKPPELKGRGKAWELTAATLLERYSPADVKSAAEYALNHQKFWRAKMMRFGPTDPFEYFMLKIPELLEQFATAQRAGRAPKPATQEARHGQQTSTGKSAAELSREKSRAASDAAKQAIRRRYGEAGGAPD
jgi:hypothetical protein